MNVEQYAGLFSIVFKIYANDIALLDSKQPKVHCIEKFATNIHTIDILIKIKNNNCE